MRLPKIRVLPKDRLNASKKGVVRFIHTQITRTDVTNHESLKLKESILTFNIVS
jgi:hypothetical protein